MKQFQTIILIILTLLFNSCQSQVKEQKGVRVNSVIDSTKCMNNNEKYVFEFPDVLGKNENNFYNDIIMKDYLNYVEINAINLTPKELINFAVNQRKKECNNINFSGFIGSNYKIAFNNSNFLSLSMNYESLAGGINIDTYNYNFDLSNNKILTDKDVFETGKITELINKCNRILKIRLKELYSENKEELNASEVYKSLINSKNMFDESNLNSFLIQQQGIFIDYNFGFENGEFDIENGVFLPYTDKGFFKNDFLMRL
jgi:hypothetical protein